MQVEAFSYANRVGSPNGYDTAILHFQYGTHYSSGIHGICGSYGGNWKRLVEEKGLGLYGPTQAQPQNIKKP